MTQHNIELQQALYTHLNNYNQLSAYLGDPPRIYDAIPIDSELPLVTIGEARVSNIKGTENAFEHEIMINVFSKYAGFKEVKSIINLLYKILIEDKINTIGFSIVNIKSLFSDVLRLSENDLMQGVIKLRIVTEGDI